MTLRGLGEVTITPLDESGAVAEVARVVSVEGFKVSVLDDFDDAEEIVEFLTHPPVIEMEFSLTNLSKEMLVFLKIACRCCYGFLPKTGRCRACVARP